MAQGHMDRLSSIDASFLTNETSSAHMHVGAILIFEGPPPAYEDFLDHVRSRLHLVPRFRQKLAFPPIETGRPFWVDDPHFHLAYHVRHSALPAPGSEEQLRNIAGRLFSQALDRSKPLWELWLIQGLEQEPVRAGDQDPPRAGRRRLRRRHRHRPVRRQARAGADRARPRLGAAALPLLRRACGPRRAPSSARPRSSWPAARSAPRAIPMRTTRKVVEAGEALGEVAWNFTNPAPDVPLNAEIGSHRRFAWTRAELGDFKRIKDALGGTVNDVVLTVVSGALRSWLREPRDEDRGTRAARAGAGLDPRRGRARPARQPDRRDARAAAGLHRGPGEAAATRSSARWGASRSPSRRSAPR